jgi:ectoine hydroxylase-related dioxygenase (phytanoyl-CoA dioxygenase family)
MPSLQPEQITHYREQGYVLPQGDVFDPSRFEKLVAVFEEDLERYGADDLDVIHDRDDRLFEFLFDDAVLDMVEPLVGPDIALWSSHFISKPPRTGRETPWHEDATYWDGRMDNWERVLTVWVALDRVDTENGCMRVIPGSHLTESPEYEHVDISKAVFDRKIKDEAVDESLAVDFTLQPNQCSSHDSRIVHGAKANTSDRRRAGYTMRYFPTTSRVVPERNLNHSVWLARGVDHAGNVYRNA